MAFLSGNFDIGNSVPIVQQNYCGDANKNGLRNGKGCQTWTREYLQRYHGSFFQDNLHGDGVYVIQDGKNKTIYCGGFYANTLEGYIEMLYPDGSYEGLLKSNKRFGPGVRTWLDNTQDVGLWHGEKLFRLSKIVLPEWVPKLARSKQGKVILLKYRKLIPICSETPDKAKEILTKLNANSDVLEQSYKLYNPLVRNHESLFFNRCQYDEIFFRDKDCFIEVEMTPEEILNSQKKRNSKETGPHQQSEKDDTLHRTQTEEEEEPIKINNMFDEDCDCACGDSQAFRTGELEQEIRRIDIDLAVVKSRHKQVQKKLTDMQSELTQNIDASELENEGCDRAELENDIKKSREKFDELTKQLHWLTRLGENLKRQLLTETKKITQPKIPTKKVFVTDLLAWNSEKLPVLILKHCFLHKNAEQNASFDVSKIIAGDRSNFRQPGTYEQSCTKLLSKSSDGKSYEVDRIIQRFDLNPDLTDARGNSAVIYAAARDRVHTIKVLLNNGANIDLCNDEDLTALNICILRYLAVQNDVSDWESAFLPKTLTGTDGNNEIYEWHARESLTSFNSSKELFAFTSTDALHTSEIFAHEEDSVTSLQGKFKQLSSACGVRDHQLPYLCSPDARQKYVLDTECQKQKSKKTPNKKSKKKRPNSATKKSKTKKKTNSNSKSTDNEKPQEKMQKKIKSVKLDVIEYTIKHLLAIGSDPNKSQVPMPAVVLSVFTKNPNLVKGILLHQADPNAHTQEENMTALHVLVSLPPFEESLEICKALLENSADPNVRTSSLHWKNENKFVLGKKSCEVVDDHGKTPLHLLALRPDFLNDKSNYLHQLALKLIASGCYANSYYLGHTPLTLAMLRANVPLVKCLLETGRVNPNQPLGEEMGVPLTVFILKRYANIQPSKICKQIYNLLVSFGANPFDQIEDVGNAIEFMEMEHQTAAKAKSKKKDKKQKKKTKKSSKKSSSKTSKTSKKGKSSKLKSGKQGEIKRCLLEIARDVLAEHIQMKALRYLSDFVNFELADDDISLYLARFLTPREALNLVQILVYNGLLDTRQFNCEKLYNLLTYIKSASDAKPSKRSLSKSVKSTNTSTTSSSASFKSVQEVLDLMRNLDIQRKPKMKGKYGRPQSALDKNTEKYKVCFFCCMQKNKQLIICPKCELVYFCSEDCNKKSIKLNTFHKCNLLFYSKIKAAVDKNNFENDWWTSTSKLTEKFNAVQLKKQEQMVSKSKWAKSKSLIDVVRKQYEICLEILKSRFHKEEQERMSALLAEKKKEKSSSSFNSSNKSVSTSETSKGSSMSKSTVTKDGHRRAETETQETAGTHSRALEEKPSANQFGSKQKTKIESGARKVSNEISADKAIAKELTEVREEKKGFAKEGATSLGNVAEDENGTKRGKRTKNAEADQLQKTNLNSSISDENKFGMKLHNKSKVGRNSGPTNVKDSNNDVDKGSKDVLNRSHKNPLESNEDIKGKQSKKTKKNAEAKEKHEGQNDDPTSNATRYTSKMNKRLQERKAEDKNTVRFPADAKKHQIQKTPKVRGGGGITRDSTISNQEFNRKKLRGVQPSINFQNETYGANRKSRGDEKRAKTGSSRSVSLGRSSQKNMARSSTSSYVAKYGSKGRFRSASTPRLISFHTKEDSAIIDTDVKECKSARAAVGSVQKTSEIPKKYLIMLEQITKCFKDLNIPEMFLPYACYANGQLYYRFYKLMKPIFCRTYSVV